MLFIEVDEATAGIFVLAGGGLDGPGLSGHHGVGKMGNGLWQPQQVQACSVFQRPGVSQDAEDKLGAAVNVAQNVPAFQAPVPPLPDLSAQPLGFSVFPKTSPSFLSPAPAARSRPFMLRGSGIGPRGPAPPRRSPALVACDFTGKC